MLFKKSYSGFTLIEMAVVLIIVGLLLGGLFAPLSAQIDQRNYNDAQKALTDMKEALLGYAMSHTATDGHPFFPCPDTNSDGLEDRTSNICSNVEGDIPWATLGIAAIDSWGNRYHYRVSGTFSDSATGFTLLSNGNISIKDASGGNNIATSVPAVIICKGKNNAGTGLDESENSNADTNFVSHTPSNIAGNEFDDLVAWISPAILFNRMVSAGKLP